MLVYPQGSDSPLRADLILRAVLRTDLTPIPATVELEGRVCDEVHKAFTEDAIVRVGVDRTEFKIIKVHDPRDDGLIQGSRQTGVIKAVGILASCAPIAARLQRAVIREGSMLGDIYRACGAQVRIDSDFTVPVFAALVGMVPSFAIAQALQEEAGVLVYAAGRIKFRRLGELKSQDASLQSDSSSAPLLASSFLERHTVPFGVSTDASGSVIAGRSASARGAVYRPRADERILNNLSTALIQRRKLSYIFTPSVNAGSRIDVDGSPTIVITAAHIYDAGESGGSADMSSLFWLGEVVK
jgi:hypothetical protein